jgi:transposase
MLRNGNAWRALPSEFGHWGTAYQYWNRLCLAGFFDFLHDALVCGDTSEAAAADSAHCKVHQHATGARGKQNQAIGRSRGGLNTKLHAVADLLGRLAAKLVITAGNVSDHTVAPALTGTLRDLSLIADKGYDSSQFRKQLEARGCEPCIPSRKNTRKPAPYDKELYKCRHVIENLFQRLKVFRRVATRYEKTDRMFLMFVLVALSAIYEARGLFEPL